MHAQGQVPASTRDSAISAAQDPASAAAWLLADESRIGTAATSVTLWQELLSHSPQDSAKEETGAQVLADLRLLRNAATRGQTQALILDSLIGEWASFQWLAARTRFASDQERMIVRFFVQALSNSITSNEQTKATFWGFFTDNSRTSANFRTLEMLVDTSDESISVAAQVLMLNCSIASLQRSSYLASDPSFTPILALLLRIAHRKLELDDDDVDQELDDEHLGVLYAIFKNLFAQGLFGQVFLSLQGAHEREHGTINTEQVTLLKLYDSYLHLGVSDHRPESANVASPEGQVVCQSFLRLAKAAEAIMLGDKEAPWEGARSELVAAHQGLVLMMRVILAFVLPTQASRTSSNGAGLPPGSSQENRTLLDIGLELVTTLRSPNSQAVEQLVSLLQTTAKFSPAVSPFQPTSASAARPPEGHGTTQTGRAAPIGAESGNSSGGGKGLDFMKRELLRMITALVYVPANPADMSSEEREAVKQVQDRVRESGGLFEVLNMTVLDVENPYMKEHAILALRYLLAGNAESQDLISKLRPINGN